MHCFTGDALLAQKLKEELTYETENADAALPEFVKEFEAQGVWKVRALGLSTVYHILTNILQIENTVGQEEVALTRSFGNETYVVHLHTFLAVTIITCSQYSRFVLYRRPSDRPRGEL